MLFCVRYFFVLVDWLYVLKIFGDGWVFVGCVWWNVFVVFGVEWIVFENKIVNGFGFFYFLGCWYVVDGLNVYYGNVYFVGLGII